MNIPALSPKQYLVELLDLVKQQEWKKAVDFAKEITTSVETNLRDDNNRKIYNLTTQVVSSYAGMNKYNTDKHIEIYIHLHQLHIFNIECAIDFVSGKKKEEIVINAPVVEPREED